MRLVFVAISVLAFVGSALAQHSHGSQKGPNGGLVQDVAGVHLELITSGTTLTVHVLDESNKPASAQGMTANALVVSGADRETLVLKAEDGSLKGETKKPIARDATISLTVKTAAGKTGQAKFAN